MIPDAPAESPKQVTTNFPSGKSVSMPADVFWPIRIRVANDGDPLPFNLLLLYHWQFTQKDIGR